MQIINGTFVFGDHTDTGALAQMQNVHQHALTTALMADNHLGYGFPIGGVAAYANQIAPAGVGFDIGCGVKAVKTDMTVLDMPRDNCARLLDEMAARISFGVGRINASPVDHALFDDDAWKLDFVAPLKDMARNQLGTVGSGNHYVDILADADGFIWVAAHFGSRGLGHKIATYVFNAMGQKDDINAVPLVIETKSSLGTDYLEAMRLAGQYAYAGRDWVVDQVVDILGARVIDTVHNHHNFAWRETHGNEKLWVVRKGATPAWPGQRGFIGGSMGDQAVIVSGLDTPQAVAALRSTVHGAGRAMSRNEARGKIDRKTGRIKTPGKISRQAMDEYLARTGVIVRGGDTDEAPQAYKRIEQVLAAHEGSVLIDTVLRPVAVMMASREVVDAYKD